MRKRARRGHPLVFCYYCDKTFTDERYLIEHQRHLHFRCYVCRARTGRLSRLKTHLKDLHDTDLTSVPNAKFDRSSIDVDVYGMRGIPRDALDAFNAAQPEDPPQPMLLPSPAPMSAMPPPMPLAPHPFHQGFYPAQACAPCGGPFPPQVKLEAPAGVMMPGPYPLPPPSSAPCATVGMSIATSALATAGATAAPPAFHPPAPLAGFMPPPLPYPPMSPPAAPPGAPGAPPPAPPLAHHAAPWAPPYVTGYAPPMPVSPLAAALPPRGYSALRMPRIECVPKPGSRPEAGETLKLTCHGGLRFVYAADHESMEEQRARLGKHQVPRAT